MRTALHRLPGHFLIGQAAQHQDEKIWRSQAYLIHRLDAFDVR